MKLALPPILAVVCGLFLTTLPASAQVGTLGTVWQRQAGAPNTLWSAIASSADGTKLIAAIAFQPNLSSTVYLSTNSGITWSPTSVSQNIGIGRTVASSANGQTLAVATENGLFISTNSGAAWMNPLGVNSWVAIACSTNGTTIVAAMENGQLYVSTDSGTSWATHGPGNFSWADIASSGDGTKLVAVSGTDNNLGQIYTSSDSGTTWTASTLAQQYWTGVASSADGTKLVAVDAFDDSGISLGAVYTSTNSGTNWNRSPTVKLYWMSVACSYDGNKIAVTSANISEIDPSTPGLIFDSTDSGTTWNPAYAPANGNWAMIASSADGTRLAAVNNSLDNPGNIISGNIYTYALPATNQPALNISTAGGNSFLSWPWPATGYVLQQNTDLATTNWVTVGNPAAVVNQVIAAQTNANNFYRLVSP